MSQLWDIWHGTPRTAGRETFGMKALCYVPPAGLTSACVADEPWHEWLAIQMQRRGWRSQAEVIKATGLSSTALSKWLDPTKDLQPSIANCRRVAKAFDVPLLNVLVAAGHLTREEAGMAPLPVEPRSVADMTPGEAVEELRRVTEELRRKVWNMQAELNQLLALGERTPADREDLHFEERSAEQPDWRSGTE